ncbi:MAG: helix-turn-helix domain-containing protein [Rhodobacteraceae bacterium]|nr:helix-turn-helix domain-containing protein [Paracoccaceae bacterium]
MTLAQRFEPDLLRHALLARLGRFDQRTAHGLHSVAGQLFTYCALDRERIAAIRLDHPLIGIVLRGSKELWIGDRCEVQRPGDVFILPRQVSLDVVNIPEERSGYYESLIFEVADLPPATRPRIARGSAGDVTFGVPLSPDLVEAICHAATSIADAGVRAGVSTHRLGELFALLQDAPAARSLFERSLAETAAWHIAGAPSETWSVDRLARALGLGASTLRRRLAAEGTSFRRLLAEVRMAAAARALDGGASRLAAAEAAGYASRSHFARVFRERFGAAPAERQRAAEAPRSGNLS